MTLIAGIPLNPPRLTIEDVAHYLRTDAATITHWLETGQLPGYRLPDRWLVMTDELLDYLRTHRSNADSSAGR